LDEHMRTHSSLAHITGAARGAAIALGNFDGVHLGHQGVIAATRAIAQERGVSVGVAVFEPHPRRFLSPNAAPFRLQTSRQRARAFAQLGVNDLFEIGFDAALTQLSDEDFATHVLSQQIGAAHVSVGFNFRFGRGRMGDAASLRRLGDALGFTVSATAPVASDGVRISSTLIREAIATGDMERAASLLGRVWAIEGVVQHGFARGRGFGFATANLALDDYVRPRFGVYAVRVLVDGGRMPGVASVGLNPTVGALPAPLLEAHIFDFDADLYGKSIEVELARFLREEHSFEDVEAMKRQMFEDARAARAALL
jgi:riboflavin kinase / FMN adenylyltransferase